MANKFKLNKEQADFIKDLRVIQEGTWRYVAEEVSFKYPELWVDGVWEYNRGNQNDGIELCNAAMKLLNESEEDGWN